MTEFERYQDKPLVVLGATGFIGRWVARLLTEAGARLTLVVRERNTAQALFARYGIRGEIVSLDLREPAGLQPIMAAARPAATFNIAGYGIDRTERDEELAQRINVDLPKHLGTLVTATHDSNWPGQQLIHVGTAMEYGDISGDVAEDSLANPTTLYGKSKLAGTEVLHQVCQREGVRAVTGRLFTVYGPGEIEARLLSLLLRARHHDEKLKFTAGTHRRDFAYVAEAAAGLLRLGLVVGQPAGIVNVATGRLQTVRHFIEVTARVLGLDQARLAFGALPTRPEEQSHDDPSIARLLRLTGWQPTITIAEGIRRTAAFVDESATQQHWN